MPEKEMFHGGWATSGNHSYTTLMASPLETEKIFRLTCREIVGEPILQFKVNADGREIIAPLNEGGSVFVEGRSISIKQITNGSSAVGTWEVMQTEPVPTHSATWLAPPDQGGESLVAAFASAQDFVLGFNRKSNGCQNGEMRVFIDGDPILGPNGSAHEFLEGSSVIGHGRTVSVQVSGECDSGESFRGEVKIRERG